MTSSKSLKYAKISLKRRVKLVELVSQPNMSIAKAARMLGLKPSTAKLIVKRYREEGSFFESKTAKEKRLEVVKQAERRLFLEENRSQNRREDQQNHQPQEIMAPAVINEDMMSHYLWNLNLYAPQNQQYFFWAFPSLPFGSYF